MRHVPSRNTIRSLSQGLPLKPAALLLALALVLSPPASAELFLAIDRTGEMVLVDLDRTDQTLVSDVFQPLSGKSELVAETVGGAARRPDGSVLVALVPKSEYDASNPQAGWGLYRYSAADRSMQLLVDLPEAVNAIATGPGNRLFAVTFDPVRFVHVDLADGSFTDLGAFDIEPSSTSIVGVRFADLEWIPERGQFLFVHRDITAGFDVWLIDGDGGGYELVDHDLPSFSAVYHVTHVDEVGVVMVSGRSTFLLDLDAAPVVLVDDDRVTPGSLVYRELFGQTPIGAVPFLASGGFEPLGDLACEPTPTTLCLQDGRFEVRARWVDPFDGTEKPAGVVQQTVDSGSLWFLQPSNQEALVKVLDTCGVNGHRWVFASASTTLAFELEVRDTTTGLLRSYSNPPGNPAPAVNDTSAFPCS